MLIPVFLSKKSRAMVVLAVICGICSGAANIGLLAVINLGLAAGRAKGGLVLSFVALCACMVATEIFSQLILIRLGQGAIYELRTQLCRQILRLPLRRLEEIGPYRLLAVLTDDIVTITNFSMFIPTLCISLAVLVGCVFYMAMLSWVSLLGVLGFMIFGIGSYRLILKKASTYMSRAREQSDQLLKHIKALTEGNKELKLHRNRAESFFSQLLQAAAAYFRDYSVMGMSLYAAASSYGQILFLILIGLLVFGLSALGLTDPHIIMGSTLTILFIRGPMQTVLNVLPNFGRAKIALRKVESLGLSTEQSNEALPPKPIESRENFEQLELLGITYVYDQKEEKSFTLGPIDLNFYPGEFTFISGGNGSGKTSLGKVLTGLYVPESGSIRLNGRQVTEETGDYYRQHFSAVFSDFYLFDGLLGLEQENLDTQAERYLRTLQIDHKIRVRNGSFSTTDLSQGQRKRLALLVAYLEDRPIYVFDEWAADQDPNFKEVFYQSLLPELKAKGKCLLVISHDEKYYHLADRVVKLECGKVDRIEYNGRSRTACGLEPPPVEVEKLT